MCQNEHNVTSLSRHKMSSECWCVLPQLQPLDLGEDWTQRIDFFTGFMVALKS